MTKEALRNKIVEIASMDSNELKEFEARISISNLTGKPREWLTRAIDLKWEFLNMDSEEVELLAVSSEISQVD